VTKSTNQATDLIVALHAIGAFRFGDFVLKDGRHSPFYVDLRLLVSHPKVLSQAAHALLERSAGIAFDRIAGIPYAGLPLAIAMALESGRPLIYPRKEAKTYGTKKQVEGLFAPGERALVVDDVVTTGGAKIEAVEPLRQAGLVVEDIIVVVDRQQNAEAVLQQHGLRLHRVVRIDEALDALEAVGRISGDEANRARKFIEHGR
jgi:uridine monophosphate synthetase